ncbi:MAG: MFS transporter [Proteobacteria bacterium]|nr:MFS transporter [Pseudomonadota bacterium]
MKKYLRSLYGPAILGASIDGYDIALYGYMAPVLVQVFLPHLDKTTAYFFYFLFEFFAAICQLLGARFYGDMGDKYGRKHAMYQSMLGTSCVTFMICLLPTYQACGFIAALLFALMRAMQSFFLGGEYNGGAIYCLEHEEERKRHGLVSGLYCAFTVSGIVIASLTATACNMLGPEYFRVAYAVSFLFALFTYIVRSKIQETPEYLRIANNSVLPTLVIVKKQKFVALILASLFFGMLYGLPTRILNALLPLTTTINTSQIMVINSVFLALYMVLLVVAGWLADLYGAKRVMRIAVSLSGVLAYPLMLLIETKAFAGIILAKAIFAALTAAFMGPFHSWAQRLFPVHNRYKNISMCYATGKCSSTILLAGSVLIFEHYQNVTSLGVILAFIAIITMRIFYETSTQETFKAVPSNQH